MIPSAYTPSLVKDRLVMISPDTPPLVTGTQADTEGDDADPNLVSMATPDEICALPAMDMEVTDVRYEGTLIPQVSR